MAVVICYACRDPVPDALAQKHHKTPQAVGKRPDNSPENLVFLCSGCHHSLHRIAEKILAGKMGIAKDLAEQISYDAGMTKRLLELSGQVAREMQLKHEGEYEPPDVMQITIEVRTDIYLTLRRLAKENGAKGLAPFLRHHLTMIAEQTSPKPDYSNKSEMTITKIV